MLKIYFLSSLLVAWSAKGASCEEQLIEPDTKIVGGEDAPNGGLPYQVVVKRVVSGRDYFTCSGSIIGPTWVVTAAHCTNRLSRRPDSFAVVVGSNSISSGGSRYRVVDIIQHEKFDISKIVNDISLLKLRSKLSYSSTVAPIALPEKDTPVGTECIVSGWGFDAVNGNPSDKLKMLNVTTLPIKECEQSLIEYSQKIPITEKQVCALSENGTGVCRGDSGGPLVCGNELVGVVSWYIPCATGRPDVYTNVFAFLDWIRDKIDA